MPVAWGALRVGVPDSTVVVGALLSSVGDSVTPGAAVGGAGVTVPEGTHRVEPANIVLRSKQLASFKSFTLTLYFEASPERLSPHLMRYSTQPAGISHKDAVAEDAAGETGDSGDGVSRVSFGVTVTVGLGDVTTI